MVVLSPQDALLFTVLLVCVPIQMWLQNYHIHGTSVDMRDGKLFALVREAHKGFKKYMSPYYWSMLFSYSSWTHDYPDHVIKEYAILSHEQLVANPLQEGECPAIEVFRLKFPEGYFAASVQQRRYRTDLVHYRVGQVVKHKTFGVRGVIIGWDETCKAPDEFIENSYKQEHRADVLEMANYAILIDTRDYPSPITQYYAQKDIELVSERTKIKHPDLQLYFDSFDGTRHVASKWLAAIYPED